MAIVKNTMDPEAVRTLRANLGLSAAQAADLAGVNDGAQWRKWERSGVKGPGAVLLNAIAQSPAVRRYFGVEIKAKE